MGFTNAANGFHTVQLVWCMEGTAMVQHPCSIETVPSTRTGRDNASVHPTAWRPGPSSVVVPPRGLSWPA